jgi:hypothetical protein
MPADSEEAPSHTGVAAESSSFPSPSSSTDVPAGPNTDTDASANQGPFPPKNPTYSQSRDRPPFQTSGDLPAKDPELRPALSSDFATSHKYPSYSRFTLSSISSLNFIHGSFTSNPTSSIRFSFVQKSYKDSSFVHIDNGWTGPLFLSAIRHNQSGFNTSPQCCLILSAARHA